MNLRGQTLLSGIALGVFVSIVVSSCSTGVRKKDDSPCVGGLMNKEMMSENCSPDSLRPLVDPNDRESMQQTITSLADKQVVYIGETHDRYDHHLNQLAIIRALHEQRREVSIGVEFFQEPFQKHLDDYIAGQLNEKQLLKNTEYYKRWRYDFRLYRDILVYARDNGIPVIGLNAPTEMVKRVSRHGLASLNSEDRARLPADLSEPDAGYRARLAPFHAMHGAHSDQAFERFIDVQLLWDEHMARVAADYLRSNPERTLVILAGSGHVAFPDAIPGRLERQFPSASAVVVTGNGNRYSQESVDFVIAERNIGLEKAGRMGMALATRGDNVVVGQVEENGPAAMAGIKSGDILIRIAGEDIEQPEDVRLALLDRTPGEQLWIDVQRPAHAGGGQDFSNAVTLF